MDIELIKERIKQDMAERKSPEYYKWTEEDGTEHDVFNYTSDLYFLDSMLVHIIRAGKKESESVESDLRNAYNCGICYLCKVGYPENDIYNNFWKDFDTIWSKISFINLQKEYQMNVTGIEKEYPYNWMFRSYVLVFLLWYNINKERT